MNFVSIKGLTIIYHDFITKNMPCPKKKENQTVPINLVLPQNSGGRGEDDDDDEVIGNFSNKGCNINIVSPTKRPKKNISSPEKRPRNMQSQYFNSQESQVSQMVDTISPRVQPGFLKRQNPYQRNILTKAPRKSVISGLINLASGGMKKGSTAEQRLVMLDNLKRADQTKDEKNTNKC